MGSRCVVTTMKDIGLCPKSDEVWLAPSLKEAERHLRPTYKTEFSPVYAGIQDVAEALSKTHYKSLTAPYMILSRNFSDALGETFKHSNPMAQSDWGVVSTAVQVVGGIPLFFYDLASGAADNASRGIWTALATPAVQFTHMTAKSAEGLGVGLHAIADGQLSRLSGFKSSEFLSNQAAVAGSLFYLAKGAGTGGSNLFNAAEAMVRGGDSFAMSTGGSAIAATESAAIAWGRPPVESVVKPLAIIAPNDAGASPTTATLPLGKIRQLLKDPATPLEAKKVAIRALGERGLVDRLGWWANQKNPDNVSVAIALGVEAVEALARIGTPKTTTILVGIIKRPGHYFDVAERAAHFLGEKKVEAAIPTLSDLAAVNGDRHNPFQIRLAKASVEALGKIGTPEALAAAHSVLQRHDAYYSVREYAARLMGDHKVVTAIPDLKYWARYMDSDYQVDSAALARASVEALAQMDTPQAWEVLGEIAYGRGYQAVTDLAALKVARHNGEPAPTLIQVLNTTPASLANGLRGLAAGEGRLLYRCRQNMTLRRQLLFALDETSRSGPSELQPLAQQVTDKINAEGFIPLPSPW